MIELTILNWLLALLPILSIVILMLALRWGGSKAGAFSWFLAIVLSVFVFEAGFQVLAYAQIRALMLTLDVLYIIWMALLFFHVSNEAGVIEMIGGRLNSLTHDRTLQGLVLGWLFVSFLQGIGGFGVPVAVVAPLLIGIGFSPVQAVLIASIGHGWAVNFGSMATSFQTMIAVTGIPGEVLAPDSAIFLGVSSLVCGLLVAWLSGGWKGLLKHSPLVVVLAALMSVVQYFLTTHHLWTLGATVASLCGLLVTVVYLQIRRRNQENEQSNKPPEGLSLGWVAFPYILLVGLASCVFMIPSINQFVNQVQLSLTLPEVVTGTGLITPGGETRPISLFGHPGAILAAASLISMWIYARLDAYKSGYVSRIMKSVVTGAVTSSLGILAMVSVAMVMSHSGMTQLLAQGLSDSISAAYYPLVAPLIGMVGAFITGSNNNSNVLFAVLQMQTAAMLGIPTTLILAAQTAGGSLGSVFAPAKVIVGCSTVGLAGQEGKVLGKIILYGMIPIIVVAIFGFVYLKISTGI
ncbi:MAG: L-lactate permease [Anaerolineaceae bacterium]|nr:L-lactate permease [Anaerolineaceae bacterium]